jgi:hypothetical protein
MSTISVSIQGAESLEDVFDVAVEETTSARAQGVDVELKQVRGSIIAAIVLLAPLVQPYVKEFITKFLGRVAEKLADRLVEKKPVEPFSVTVNHVRYNLPADLQRMRQEQGLA